MTTYHSGDTSQQRDRPKAVSEPTRPLTVVAARILSVVAGVAAAGHVYFPICRSSQSYSSNASRAAGVFLAASFAQRRHQALLRIHQAFELGALAIARSH
jgi:hypothetical protein